MVRQKNSSLITSDAAEVALKRIVQNILRHCRYRGPASVLFHSSCWLKSDQLTECRSYFNIHHGLEPEVMECHWVKLVTQLESANFAEAIVTHQHTCLVFARRTCLDGGRPPRMQLVLWLPEAEKELCESVGIECYRRFGDFLKASFPRL